jgi:superfamily II DNA or RNA helicase
MTSLYNRQDQSVVCWLTPRDYQGAAVENSFRLYDSGRSGILARAFTGAGKTVIACMLMAQWLARDPKNRCLVVSYETQLVWQFAKEIKEFLNYDAGIEMASQHVDSESVPFVTVACRASLLRNKEPDEEVVKALEELGVDRRGCDRKACLKLLRMAKKGATKEELQELVELWHQNPLVVDGCKTRLHKFDPTGYNWLVIYDEAHRHAKSLVSVGHIAEWFEKNPASWRVGITATPQRSDRKSVGYTMFPVVALDYPLYRPDAPCGVRDGWCVPYLQRYVQVEGVDFKHIKKIGNDFDPSDLEKVLNQEMRLAKLIEPTLDLCESRRTLIFNPGVEMAKNVAAYINARSPALCPCGKRKWYSRKLIGDGAQCPCGRLIEPGWALTQEEQAIALWGEIPDKQRATVYDEFKQSKYQFLCVCGLCREGFNDPDIGCVAIFRPVSKKASGLAEQMKGRGCRPARSIIAVLGSIPDSASRLKAIAESSKPDCLIVDLVGVSGLGECASTVQIYADGLPDEVKQRAEELLLEKGQGESVDVEETIAEAKRLCEEERERLRQEKLAEEKRKRELSEKRSKAGAEVEYSAEEIGYGSQTDPNEASDNQYRYMRMLGMEIEPIITKRQTHRIIEMLKNGVPPEEVAYKNNLRQERWKVPGPTDKQREWFRWRQLPVPETFHHASLIIGAKKNPQEMLARKLKEIKEAISGKQLDRVGKDVAFLKKHLRAEDWNDLVAFGRERRRKLGGP